MLLVVVAGAALWYQLSKEKDTTQSISSFDECEAAGLPVMESYPRKCIAHGVTYVERVSDVIIESSSETLVRYTAGADSEKARADCDLRDGRFNECGSACEDEAEICIDVCALVCELGEGIETSNSNVNASAD